MERSELYAPKSKSSPITQCTPLVMDTNPALPNMNYILNKHKYILGLDEDTKNIIPGSSIFVSNRGAKNIKDILIHSKLKPITDEDAAPNNASGCFKCNATRCYLCKNYLNVTKTVTSQHTSQVFEIESILTCNTECVIYIIDCLKCCLSYVGYTTGNMKKRFSNDKTHIKTNSRTCTIVNHYLDLDHNLVFYPNNSYDKSFSNHAQVTLIEKVVVDTNDSQEEKERKCELRERYWQSQLKTFERYGGLNKRHSKKYGNAT